jgi:hypothetical protein
MNLEGRPDKNTILSCKETKVKPFSNILQDLSTESERWAQSLKVIFASFLAQPFGLILNLIAK